MTIQYTVIKIMSPGCHNIKLQTELEKIEQRRLQTKNFGKGLTYDSFSTPHKGYFFNIL